MNLRIGKKPARVDNHGQAKQFGAREYIGNPLAEFNPESWPEIRAAGRLFTAIERLEQSTAAASIAERRLRLDITRSKAARATNDAAPAAEDDPQRGRQ